MLSPAAWLDAVHLKSSGELAPDILSNTDHANELIMMGLRLKGGISQSRIEAVVGKEFDITTELTDLGLLNISDGFIKATNSGRALLNQVIQKLMF
jgi:oxygen-independent coproporphyrinogen-3 oxidase